MNRGLPIDTKIYKLDQEDSADRRRILEEAGAVIRRGGLVAFPTETVYGLGGDAFNPASSEKIYAAKGRPSDNPLIVHIADMASLDELAAHVPDNARRLAEAFWPGPLTMIFEKKDRVPTETTGGLSTVAVRFPSHTGAAAFIRAAGGFIAAPSANLSGRPSPTSARFVIEDMAGRIDMILDGGDSVLGLESTIVDMTSETPMILRPGFVTRSMLESVLGEVGTDPALETDDPEAHPKAPGMKYRHYAPKGDLRIVEGAEEAVVAYINEQAALQMAAGEKVGIIATDDTLRRYKADVCLSAGNRTEEGTIAHMLYRILREFDDAGVTRIYAESFAGAGLGEAIMNRLLKAAGHQLIDLSLQEK